MRMMIEEKSKVYVYKGMDPFEAVEKILDFFEKPSGKVVLKPNLINTEPPPTTTPCETIEALIKYYLKLNCEVIVAEGSGWTETFEAYRRLGYLKLKEKYGVKLVDLNNDDYELMRNENALFLKEFELPLTLKDAYIVSVPVLKEHSITGVTLSMKNMLGATLGERGRIAKKGRFHRKLNESIVDINVYLKPRLAVIDGRIAGIGGEIGSKPKKIGVMIFSQDLVAADTIGAKYLGKDPEKISHIKLAKKIGLGRMDLDKIEVIEVT